MGKNDINIWNLYNKFLSRLNFFLNKPNTMKENVLIIIENILTNFIESLSFIGICKRYNNFKKNDDSKNVPGNVVNLLFQYLKLLL